MNRQIKDRYIPLKSRPLGDSHLTVLMLTAEQGLIYAAAFGAAGKQSKLRPLIQPFSLCEGDLYFDPVKKLWRLKDGNCLVVRESFHQSLKKYYAALFWAELAVKTHGGAGGKDFFELTAAYLDDLEGASGKMSSRILASAIWAFLAQEGIRPDLDSCARCGRKAPDHKAVCYDPEGHVVCAGCRIGDLPVLTSAGRSFLSSLGDGELDRADSLSLYDYLLHILRALTGFRFEEKGLHILLGLE